MKSTEGVCVYLSDEALRNIFRRADRVAGFAGEQCHRSTVSGIALTITYLNTKSGMTGVPCAW